MMRRARGATGAIVGLVSAAVLAALLGVGPPEASAGPPAAKRILDATGVTGGLIVHLGCGDGKLTAALAYSAVAGSAAKAGRAGERYVVHGLTPHAKNVAAARKHVASLGLAGAVSVEQWSGSRLPYADNLVNLIVVAEPAGVTMEECLRVLVPNGVAYVRKGDEWAKTVKPRPATIDEWTHFLYDASGNAVARDTRVGPPRRIQWLAGPKRSRDHDALASLSAMTSSGGRIFYIYDEGPTSLIHHPADWKLIARDAFNGALLWKRDIPSWITHLYYFRSGPVWLGRRLVSAGGCVYVTLGLDQPVTALDAETGKTLRTYEGSAKAEEILHHDGVLLVAVGDPASMNKQARDVWAFWEYTVDGAPPSDRAVLAYRADTGRLLWKKTGRDVPYLLPLSLTAAGRRAFYMDGRDVRCVDLETGKEQWRSGFPTRGLFIRNYAPTVVAAAFGSEAEPQAQARRDGVLLCLTRDRLAAFSIADGKKLWETLGYKGFASPGDLFVVDGVAWTLPVTAGGVRMPREKVLGDGGQKFHGFDIRTGKIKRTFLKKKVWPGGHHHRCYRNKATTRYLITSRRGLEFIDLRGDGHMMNWWVRGECQYGVMPCNGLVYLPPDPCRCFNLVKVDGFRALAAGSSLDGLKTTDAERLTRGPAYAPQAKQPAAGKAGTKAAGMVWHPPVRPAGSDDWPTYRRDVTRSGSTARSVPTELTQRWEADVGGTLTSPVVAAGKLLISSIGRNTVYCLDSASGKRIWEFVAGGPVDSPPTLSGDLVLFGSRDGCVYAVRAADGKAAWRFRAAPTDCRILVDGRLESVWPVHGSVLVLNGAPGSGRVAYCAAGRSSYLDGGIYLYGLDVASGRKLYEARVHAAPNPIGTQGPAEEMTPALPDVLVSNGTSINMRQVRFDTALARQPAAGLDTLVSATGLVEAAWAHRHNTTLGVQGSIRYDSHNGALRYGPANPFGKLVVFDDRCAYAVQTLYTFLKHSRGMWPPTHRGHLHQKYATYTPQQFPTGVRLYAQDNQRLAPKTAAGGTKKAAAPRPKRRRRRSPFTSTAGHRWSVRIPLQVRGMVLAGETIFAAGWLDSVKIYEKTADAGAPRLWALSTQDGKKLTEYKLDAPPVFDGLIAAKGKLYLAGSDGKVTCWGAK